MNNRYGKAGLNLEAIPELLLVGGERRALTIGDSSALLRFRKTKEHEG